MPYAAATIAAIIQATLYAGSGITSLPPIVAESVDSHDKRVTRAAPATGVLPQRAALDEIQDVTVGRVLRTLGELGVFGCRELSLEAVEQSVQHLDLARIQRLLRKAFPEARLPQHRAQGVLRALDCAEQARKEPFLPRRNIEGTLLRAFERR